MFLNLLNNRTAVLKNTFICSAKVWIYSFVIIACLCSQSAAQPICPLDGSVIQPKMVKSIEQFKRIPILQDGRVKPMDSYARNILLQFSGKRSYLKTDATSWLIRLLMAPSTTRDDKVFLINNPAIVDALSLEFDKGKRYSYTQLEPSVMSLANLAEAASQIKQKDRDVVENEIIRLFNNLQLYSRLSLSFSFAFPHADFVVNDQYLRSQLSLPKGQSQFSFLDIALEAGQLLPISKSLENKSPESWSNQERLAIDLISNLYQWSVAYQDLPFKIIPPYTNVSGSWISPWDAVNTSLADQNGREEILYLRDMFVAFWNGQQVAFDLAIKGFNSVVKQRSDMVEGVGNRIELELFYNHYSLLLFAKIIYFVSFLLFLLSFATDRNILYRASYVLILVGFIANLIALILRIIILARPPVSTLYETFIFVGIVSVLSGIIIERIHRQWLGVVIAAISGFVFLMIADKFALEGDTLKVLVAVLNSNFWLGFHVTTITTGYAGTCVAGIIGHVYILQAIFKSNQKALLLKTQKILLGSLGFALTLTFLGTNLGGIWADQSWGRFWGWDPKENGALLIILWIAILFHAKIGKMIDTLGLAVGSALGIIVVMWAWFGVNLLSVGLHSYGFTAGLARNLSIYCILQILFLVILTPMARRKLN